MATVGSFGSRPHADMAAAMLEARGISARVLGDDAGGAAPFTNLAHHGGYALVVDDDDREAAADLLAEPPADEPTSVDAIAEAWGSGGAPLDWRRVVGKLMLAFVLVTVIWGALRNAFI